MFFLPMLDKSGEILTAIGTMLAFIGCTQDMLEAEVYY